MVMNHNTAAVGVAVDSGAVATGAIKGKTVAFQSVDQITDGRVAKYMSEASDVGHTVMATAGSSLISVGALLGIDSP